MKKASYSIKMMVFQLIGFVFFMLLGFMVEHPSAYFYGLMIALINAVVYWFYYLVYGVRKSKYQGQGLVAVISSMVVRFLVIVALILYGLRIEELSSEWLLIGFALGLFFYWFNHMLMVSKKYGK